MSYTNQHVIVLLDISYSMYHRKQKMLDGLNSFVQNLQRRADSSNIFFTLLMFSEHTYYICKATPVNDICKYDFSVFPPFGNTHLYDAMGQVFRDWISYNNISHNLFIITDGLDNGSRQINKQTASQMCDDAVKKYKWKIRDCHVHISNLESEMVESVHYAIDELDNLFSSLTV
jgi:uncharacterized protein YegL